ncbi:MAG: PAS domain-containing protein [Pirellulales bacterium]
MGPYLLLYASLIGFFGFAAIYHAVLWIAGRREPLLAAFSIDCALRTVLSWALFSILASATPAEAYVAVTIRITTAFPLMVATTWCLRIISGVRASAFVWFLTASFGLLFFLQVFVVRLNPPIVAVDRIALPWGEMVSTPIAGNPGWWVAPALGLAYLVQFFALYCGVRLWRIDRLSGGLILAAAITTLSILTLEVLRTFHVVVAPMLGAFPHVLWVCVVATLMARGNRQTHERLTASEQRFRGIFEQTFQFIGLLRTDGVVIEANRTALDFAEARSEDVVNRPFWDGPWWSHSAELRTQLRDAVRTAAAGNTVRFEVTHPRRDGGLACVDFSLKPIFDESGASLC